MLANGAVNSSVPAWGLTCPPIAKPATVFPVPPKPLLAKDKSAISVQEVPFHTSVFALLGPSPPKNNAAVDVVPDAAPCPLEVLYSATSVQDDPSHCSTLVPDAPDIARAASGKDNVAFCGYHGWHDWYLATNIKKIKI